MTKKRVISANGKLRKLQVTILQNTNYFLNSKPPCKFYVFITNFANILLQTHVCLQTNFSGTQRFVRILQNFYSFW